MSIGIESASELGNIPLVLMFCFDKVEPDNEVVLPAKNWTVLGKCTGIFKKGSGIQIRRRQIGLKNCAGRLS